MINVKNLSFAYEKNAPKVIVNISFTIGEGELIALIGKNGSGKSTLFKCMAGCLKNYAGNIYVANRGAASMPPEIPGRNIASMPPEILSRHLAYIPQKASVTFDYSVFDYVMMGTVNSLKYFERPSLTQQRKAQKSLDLLHIGKFADKNIRRLSGGEQQLVMIARAIAQDAKMIIMDEPTSFLDYGNQQLVMNAASALVHNGYGIIYSTHNPDQARAYSSRVIALHEGKILSDDIPSNVLTPALINTLYNTEVLQNE